MKRIFTLVLFVLGGMTASFAQDAPDFTFTDTQGVEHTLSDALAENKVIVLDFFFVDCPPCIQWAPEIDQLIADYESTNVEIWALSDHKEIRTS